MKIFCLIYCIRRVYGSQSIICLPEMFHILIVIHTNRSLVHKWSLYFTKHTLRLSMYSYLRDHPGSSPALWWCLLIANFFQFLCRLPVVCSIPHILFTYILFTYIFFCSSCCQTHIALCFCFICFRLMYPMMPVSLTCPFLISYLIFSNVYLQDYRLLGS